MNVKLLSPRCQRLPKSPPPTLRFGGASQRLRKSGDTARFLRAVQSVFLQKRHLETADLYEPPLDMFGADAVERWFTEKKVTEIVKFTKRVAVQPKIRYFHADEIR
jgi:hypothetical protein